MRGTLSAARELLSTGKTVRMARLTLTIKLNPAVHQSWTEGHKLIQMLKAFTPVIVMLGLLLANISTPSWQSAGCVLGISIGTRPAPLTTFINEQFVRTFINEQFVREDGAETPVCCMLEVSTTAAQSMHPPLRLHTTQVRGGC